MTAPQIDLNRIQMFLEIVRFGSITKAANAFHLQKSKVSRDLSLLEKELGTQLIYRTTRKFSLTAEGQKFFAKASEGLTYLTDAILETSRDAKALAGHISITCPEDIGQMVLIPLLDEFAKLHPKISYGINFSSENQDLVAQKIDLALRIGPLKDSSLIVKKLGSIEMGLFCSTQFFETLPQIKSLKQLSSLPTIHFQHKNRKPEWEFQSYGKAVKIPIQPIAVVDNFMAALNLTQRGFGICLLPKFVAGNDLTQGNITQVFKKAQIKFPQLQLVWPNKSEEIARVRELSNHLIHKMQEIF
ncbi:MAG: LysR family transcriptional regulator [Bdellovibrionales bacterium]|nr:LysR family transcriptional regulator [Bdellovibrionales bacterium]